MDIRKLTQNGTMMKIKVSSFTYGRLNQPGSYFDMSCAINEAYCQLHGYDYVVERLPADCQVVRHRHENWKKVGHCRRMLNDCDYLLHIDADAVFYSWILKIEEELIPRLVSVKANMVLGADVQNMSHTMKKIDRVNAGVILMKNDAQTAKMLEVWDSVSDIPEWQYTRWQWPLEQEALEYIRAVFPGSIKPLKNFFLMNGEYGQFIRHFTIGDHDNKFLEIKAVYDSPLMQRNKALLNH